MKTLLNSIGKWMIACLLAFGPQTGMSQTYPTKPVRMILGVAAGGGLDILARKISPVIGQQLGQTVIVENRAGAAGILGAQTIATAEPDGYALTMVSSSFTGIAALYKSLPYQPIESFSPVSMFALSPLVLMAHPAAPYKTIQELIAYSKANPGKLNMGSSGSGGTTHLAGELLQMLAGVSWTHVPYKGGGPAVVDLVAGRLDLLFVVTQTAIPRAEQGQVRVLATGGTQRIAAFPDVPTLKEAGVRDYDASDWSGILAPAGTPTSVVKALYDAMVKTTRSKDTRDWMIQQGLVPAETGPAEFRTMLQSEIGTWKSVVTKAGITIQ